MACAQDGASPSDVPGVTVTVLFVSACLLVCLFRGPLYRLAADEALTGGERPGPRQRHACDVLLSWLAGLLVAMPLDQSLRPRTGTATKGPAAEATVAAAAAARSETPLPEGEGEREEGGSNRHRHGHDHVDVVVDGETEQARRGMREEARSSVLRALSALLAGCADETRLSAAAGGAAARAGAGGAEVEVEPEVAATVEEAAGITRGVAISNSGRDEVAAEAARASAANSGGSTVDARACVLTPPPQTAQPQTRLVPLCLRLLSGCGGAAEPKPGVDASRGSAPVVAVAVATAIPQAAQQGDTANYGVGSTGVPAGRKVELLKVIGNACFRCRSSQDLVRDVGGLPLVLNHCAVDGANPLLR